jgi:hypothetical protein
VAASSVRFLVSANDVKDAGVVGKEAGLLEDMLALSEQRNDFANRLREEVRGWREAGYPGTALVTRRLLKWWSARHEERVAIGRRFFFCPREASLQGRPFDPIADRLRKVEVFEARGCGSLPSPSSPRPKAAPKTHDGRRPATPVGSELDNAQDNFAAGMALSSWARRASASSSFRGRRERSKTGRPQNYAIQNSQLGPHQAWR